MSAAGSSAPAGKARTVGVGAVGAVIALALWAGGIVAALIVGLALLGTPLFAILGGASEIAWFLSPDAQDHYLRFIAANILDERFAGSPILVTIPLFTFVGYVLAESKTPERLVKAADALFGWMPGGLAIVCIVASAIFTLFTGGSGVTIIALGGLLYPALRKAGYSEKFALGIVTTSGSVGLLLPLSLPLMVYSIVTGIDLMLAFKAVVVPGLLVLVLLAAYAIIVALVQKIPIKGVRWNVAIGEALLFIDLNAHLFSLGSAQLQLVVAVIGTLLLLPAIWPIKWEIGIAVILAAGLGSWLTQIDEIAGVVALYAVIVEVFIYKDLSFKKDMVRIAKSSMSLAGAVILILAMANALINYVGQKKIPDHIFEAMLSLGLDKTWQFLLVMNVFLLVLGMVMDGFSAILVAVPLVLPFAAHFALGPFHVANIFILNLELAFCMPPLGLNLFISSFRFGRPVVSLYKVVPPFAAILAVALLVVSYVPAISDVMVRGDIKAQREDAEKRNAPPREAWLLECVQHDRLNPLPCSEEDKKKYPNGQMPESAQPAENAADAGAEAPPSDEDEALLRAMGVNVGDGGAAAEDGGGGESEDDLLQKMLGAGLDAGAKTPENKADADKPASPDNEDDLLQKMLNVGKDGG